MIANEIAFGESFQANIHYNLYGNKSEPNPHKCAWYVSKNMFTDDLDAAGKIMEATASSSRATKPAYHFSIDWDRSEERFLDQGKCVAAADKVLAKMGLSEHQALYFWHVDANHPHMHVVVNRVDDATGKAWDMWKSKEKLERATHEVAQEMEFLQVPGKHNEMDYVPDKNKETTRSRPERATSEDLKPWSKEQIPDIKAEIGNAFYHAENWDELADTLSDAGFELRSKGQGLIITNGTNYTQLSKMGKQVRLKDLEDKFGESFADHSRGTALEPVTPEQLEQATDAHASEEIPEEIDKELQRQVKLIEMQRQVKLIEMQQTSQLDDDHPGSTDQRVIQLVALLDSIDRFDAVWSEQNSAAAMMMAGKKVKQQQSLLEKAKNLLEFHKQAGIDLIFSAYKKPSDDRSLNTVKKIDGVLDKMSQFKVKKRKTKRLIKLLKWRKRKIAKEQERARRHKKERSRKRKAKNKQHYDTKFIYRVQKLREASNRVTKREIELGEAKSKMRWSNKAHEQNIGTRKYLKNCCRDLVRTMPKEAIMNADLSWKEKNRLFNAWVAERDSEKARERGRKYEQDRSVGLEE